MVQLFRVRGALSHDKLQSATQEEVKMAEQDLTEADRLVAKNSVEEYIYDIRGRLCDELADFMEEEERSAYTLQLEDTENWLYEEGEDADRPAYQLRLSDLKGRGEPVKRRKREWEERPAAMNQFGQCLQLAQKVIDSYKAGEEKYSHLDAADVSKVEKSITEKSDWFNRSVIMCCHQVYAAGLVLVSGVTILYRSLQGMHRIFPPFYPVSGQIPNRANRISNYRHVENNRSLRNL